LVVFSCLVVVVVVMGTPVFRVGMITLFPVLMASTCCVGVPVVDQAEAVLLDWGLRVGRLLTVSQAVDTRDRDL
jgi:hypothetical protein